MPGILRLPIDNLLTGSLYTVRIVVGSSLVPFDVLLDTGSGLLVVDGRGYSLAADRDAGTTRLVQTAQYMSGSFLAPVIATSVSVAQAGAGPPCVLPDANLAVAYGGGGMFGKAGGILGLAYATLDTATAMPADTWINRYDADQLALGKPADLRPYLDQLAAEQLASNRFAFRVRRSATRLALDDPAADPLNAGTFVLGDGAECTELYSGAFASAAIVHERYFNTNLLAVQVGGQSAIRVPPPAPGSRADSNSIVDSGCNCLVLDQDLFAKVLAGFAAVDPGFASALLQFSVNAGADCDAAGLRLADWPALTLVLQGSDGADVALTLRPADYWQVDAPARGRATAMLCGDGGMLAGQSDLGLPLFAGRYVVFDRTASNGQGVIRFAPGAP